MIYGSMFEQLIGKTVVSILLEKDEQGIVQFKTSDDSVHSYRTEADCCNDVWINHMSGVSALKGSTISKVVPKDWTKVEGITTDTGKERTKDVEESCIWTFHTSGGYFDLELRNSHNGYYGGEMTYIGNNPTINKYSQELTTMVEILEDF